MDLDKYVTDVYKNIDKDNMYKIINFLTSKGCNFVEELLSDYLDIFSIDIEEFIVKFNELNKKYENKLLSKISEDMNILEEFYF